jgi:DNA-binding NarL/FixJ family response regulator
MAAGHGAVEVVTVRADRWPSASTPGESSLRFLAEGKAVAEVARQLQVSEQTYHGWRAQFGAMKAR